MLPDIANVNISSMVSTSTSGTSQTTMGKSFLFDFNDGDFVVKDGKIVTITDIDALKLWIEKVLKTQKFKFKIYEKSNVTMEYGVRIQDLMVGNIYPQNYIETAIKVEVNNALLKNPMIKSLNDWKIERNNPILNINFTVNLVDGTSISEEVVF